MLGQGKEEEEAASYVDAEQNIQNSRVCATSEFKSGAIYFFLVDIFSLSLFLSTLFILIYSILIFLLFFPFFLTGVISLLEPFRFRALCFSV